METISNRHWPESPLKDKHLDPSKLKEFLSDRADYEKAAFVAEGHLELRELNAKEFAAPLPRGESAVTALVAHPNGHVYGATSGANAHLFFYNPAPDADACAEAGIIARDAQIAALALAPDGTILGLGNREGKAFLFRYSPCDVLLGKKDFNGLNPREIFDLPAEDQLFFSTIDPCHSAGKLEMLAAPAFDEPASAMLCGPDGLLTILGAKSGNLYRGQAGDNRLASVGSVAAFCGFSPTLLAAPDGCVYAAGQYGMLYRLDQNGALAAMACRAPSLKGREYYNRITAWAVDPHTSQIYGGTEDGLLFEFHPEGAGKVICLGSPAALPHIAAMAVTNGKVFAVAGGPTDCCHLCCYDPAEHSLRDLGCPLAHSERPWNAYRIGAMIRATHGALFLGEEDNMGHLLIYYPEVN